jgi:hypothetical protein
MPCKGHPIFFITYLAAASFYHHIASQSQKLSLNLYQYIKQNSFYYE